MSGTYKCPIGWASQASEGNKTINTYLEKDPVTAPDMSGSFPLFDFYLWLHFFQYSIRTLMF